MSEKHSPLPWNYDNGSIKTGVQSKMMGVIGECGFVDEIAIVCHKNHEANADLIVRAVNSHEALVAACEAALDFCNDIGDGAPDAGPVERTANTLTVQLHNALDRARAKGSAS